MVKSSGLIELIELRVSVSNHDLHRGQVRLFRCWTNVRLTVENLKILFSAPFSFCCFERFESSEMLNVESSNKRVRTSAYFLSNLCHFYGFSSTTKHSNKLSKYANSKITMQYTITLTSVMQN